MRGSNREELRRKRHSRIKMRMSGTAGKPRLVVKRSLMHMAAQVVDDASGKVIFSLSTKDKTLKEKFKAAGNVKSALAFGEIFAKTAKEKGLSRIVFDRAGYLYHGRVKAFADALRKGGLEF